MKASVAPRRPPAHGPPTLESYTPFDFSTGQEVTAKNLERILLDIVLQNTSKSKLNFVQFLEEGGAMKAESIMVTRMKEIAERMPYYVRELPLTHFYEYLFKIFVENIEYIKI